MTGSIQKISRKEVNIYFKVNFYEHFKNLSPADKVYLRDHDIYLKCTLFFLADLLGGQYHDLPRGQYRANDLIRGHYYDLLRGHYYDLLRGHYNDLLRGQCYDLLRGQYRSLLRGHYYDLLQGQCQVFDLIRGQLSQGQFYGYYRVYGRDIYATGGLHLHLDVPDADDELALDLCSLPHWARVSYPSSCPFPQVTRASFLKNLKNQVEQGGINNFVTQVHSQVHIINVIYYYYRAGQINLTLN